MTARSTLIPEAFTHPRSVVTAVTEACWSQNNVRLLCYIPQLILRAWGLENARQEAAAAAALGWREGGGVRVQRRWRLGGGGGAAKAGSCWAQRGLQAAQARYPGPRLRPASADAPEPRRGKRPRARAWACELRILRLPAASGLGASRGAGRERGYAGTQRGCAGPPGGPLPPPLGFSLQAALPHQSAGRPRPGSPLPAPASFENTAFPTRFPPVPPALRSALRSSAGPSLSASHTISFLVDGVLFCSHPGLPPAFQHHPFRMSFLTVKIVESSLQPETHP
ncbi:uncharacterized protein LOC115893895 [Rhinopithecus roxellana]|uniref:uncharacterized protein LOC115893895 n=1 Tax=Rhinopithecus roxellana TaxID=61622 RepID=UPI00123756B4|nr:uncharacterized protein LOC115893895 [Rhinopithecus roxellana]